MAHEMTANDGAVFHQVPAWHGLGNVVPDELSPTEALKPGRLDWEMDQRPLYTVASNGENVLLESHVANYRHDTNVFFGVVSANYRPVQNTDMAIFCEALLDEGQVKVESAGSVRDGRQVWFLLKGEPFCVANNDEMYPYINVSNGHDGNATFRVTPTTVRVQCANTLDMVIPKNDTGALGKSAINIRHNVHVMQRVQQAKEALVCYGKAMEETKNVINILSSKSIDQEAVQNFFLESYIADFGDIPDNPKDKWEERRRDKAMSAYASFTTRFDDEKSVAGTSMWCAFNAYSGLVQHDSKAFGKDDVDRVEKRVDRNLFGLNQERTQSALQRAFKYSLSS